MRCGTIQHKLTVYATRERYVNQKWCNRSRTPVSALRSCANAAIPEPFLRMQMSVIDNLTSKDRLDLETADLLFFYRRKDESATATAVSTVWFGAHKWKEHPTTDRTRLINFHFGLFYYAGAVLKFNNHFFNFPCGSMRWVG